jgi:hypothetical protein
LQSMPPKFILYRTVTPLHPGQTRWAAHGARRKVGEANA